MKIAASALAGTIVLALATAAQAANVVTGVYSFVATNYCQPKLTVTLGSVVVSGVISDVCPGADNCQAVSSLGTNNVVKSITTQTGGTFSESIGTATFKDSTKQVTLKQIEVSGEAAITILGVGTGMPMKRTTSTKTYDYSYTATTVTVTGIGTLDAVYSNIGAGNVPGRIDVLQRQNAACVFRGSFIKQ